MAVSAGVEAARNRAGGHSRNRVDSSCHGSAEYLTGMPGRGRPTRGQPSIRYVPRQSSLASFLLPQSFR